MADQIIYQVPAIITDDSILVDYRQKGPVLSWREALLFCFQAPNMSDVKRSFGHLRKYIYDIVPGTPELVEKYARLDRELKREHGNLAQVNWGNISSVLIQLYENYLSYGPELHSDMLTRAPGLTDATPSGDSISEIRRGGIKGIMD
jgi:hypothetical protein